MEVDAPILIDPRRGSGELAPLFQILNLKSRVETLPFGDFQFEGNGAHGLGLIGIEHKRVNDIVRCMVDGRYVGHQLPGMLAYYDHCYLFVQGVTRPHPQTGVLQELHEDAKGRQYWRDVHVFTKRRFLWRDFDNFLATLEQSKAKLRRIDNAHMTVHHVASLYHWYRHKTWDEHDSLRQLYSQPYPVMHLEDKSSIVRRVAKEFDGIGVEKSLSVHMKFRTPADFINATRTEWETIPGVGPTISNNLWRQIHGEPKEVCDTAECGGGEGGASDGRGGESGV